MSAARVHRMPPRRSGVRLWSMRFLGLLATAVLLGTGAYALLQVLPQDDGATAALDGAPASTSKPKSQAGKTKAKKKAAKRRAPRLTATQRRARSAAVATLRDQGYRPVRLADYAPTHVLRVLVGRGEGGQRAFFFTGAQYLGNDASDDSERIKVVRAGNRSVSLAYRVFKPGDKPCCPSGRTRVLFRWDGKTLAPQTGIPPVSARRAPA